jgi:hypothetical protein
MPAVRCRLVLARSVELVAAAVALYELPDPRGWAGEHGERSEPRAGVLGTDVEIGGGSPDPGP